MKSIISALGREKTVEAMRNAVAKAVDMRNARGLPAVVEVGGQIVRQFPDGRTEAIGRPALTRKRAATAPLKKPLSRAA
jgi:hypothetical protein